MSSFKDVLKAKQEKQERENRPKVDWFSLKNGETKYIRFLQEFDTDGRNYDSNLGTVLFLMEHVSPEDWSRKALCSMESEGRCFPCEMDKIEPFHLTGEMDSNGNPKKKWHPWGQRSNFYAYVVDSKSDVKVLSRTTDGKFFDSLVDENKLNNNSIADLTFKISKGSANQNPWEIRSWSIEHFDLPELPELIDLKSAIGYKLPYAEQKAFYVVSDKSSVPEMSTPSENASNIGENW